MGDGIFGGLPDSAEGELNAVLRDFVESKTLPLYEMMSYQLGWGREEGEAVSLGPPPRLYGGLTLGGGLRFQRGLRACDQSRCFGRNDEQFPG